MYLSNLGQAGNSYSRAEDGRRVYQSENILIGFAFNFSRCGALTYSGGAAPGTPPADDHTVSKRSWETSVQHWRVGVKQWWQEDGRPYHLRKVDMVSSSLSVMALR